MSNIIALPNGSNWDNDLNFADQAQPAQYWFSETLKIATINTPGQTEVLMHAIIRKNEGWNRKDLCYSHLERSGLYLFTNMFYTHRDWARVMEEGYTIPDQDWFDYTKWEYPAGIRFWVTIKD